MMTFKEKLICRILLIIAKMVAETDGLKDEIKALDTHIRVGGMFDK